MNKKLLTSEEKKIKSASKIISCAVNFFAQGDYIFRGECEDFNRPTENQKPLSSGLYRQFAESGQADSFDLLAEKKIVEDASKHFPPNTGNADVLTMLQHHGVRTALIDFTENMLVALFFACHKESNDCGYLYGIDSENLEKNRSIEYPNPASYTQPSDPSWKQNILIKPSGKEPRIIFQSSVLVHAHLGYLEADKCFTIPIAKKADVLFLLCSKFAINSDTIYNDIYGYIESKKNNC